MWMIYCTYAIAVVWLLVFCASSYDIGSQPLANKDVQCIGY